ncbi:MAG: MBL fold metallo-hydrolase, partial [Candidatus Bathyarchaeota archaeon]
MEVADSIWLFKVPMMYNPQHYTFSYLLKDSYTLIDTGIEGIEARNSLNEQLRMADLKSSDIKRIIITHVHRDHIGLVNYLKALSGAKVYAHERVKKALENMDRRNRIEEVRSELKILGAGIFLSILNQYENTPRQVSDPLSIDETVVDGDILSLENVSLKVIWTPGHSQDHICLFNAERRLLFSGDHILPKISSNVSLHTYENGDPLMDYLNSLDKVRDLPVELVLPAHEHIFKGLDKRIDELKTHHVVRSEEIIRALKEGDKTVFEVTSRISWST